MSALPKIKQLTINNGPLRDGTTYAGEFHIDPATQVVSGCPARAPGVLAVKKAVQTRSKADGATRKHAEAISIEDMKKLMQSLERTLSAEQLENFADGRRDGSTTVKSLREIFECAFMKAFASSAFTLWTRSESLY